MITVGTEKVTVNHLAHLSRPAGTCETFAVTLRKEKKLCEPGLGFADNLGMIRAQLTRRCLISLSRIETKLNGGGIISSL